jgi:membrane protease YdiL (CAAX protease family)
MNMLAGWIKSHQVAAFFILAYLVAWPLLMLIFFIFPGNQLVLALSGLLAVFSPALAAMLISAIIDPKPKQGSSKWRWFAFGISWVISWIIMTLYYWQVEKLELVVAVILWAIFATFPAWILSSAFARTPGVRKHFSTILRPRGSLLWYFVALLTVPACQLLGIGITQLLGGEVPDGGLQFRLEGMSLGQTAVFLILTFLSGFLCSGGINEESGWRGFALPRLQARYPVVIAIAIVWFFWALWHIPYDIGQGISPDWILVNRTLNNFIFSVLFSWVYNRTKGSILAPAIFHPSMNTFGNHFPVTPVCTILLAGLAIFAILYDRMWKKLLPENPAVYQASQLAAQPGVDQTTVMVH